MKPTDDLVHPLKNLASWRIRDIALALLSVLLLPILFYFCITLLARFGLIPQPVAGWFGNEELVGLIVTIFTIGVELAALLAIVRRYRLKPADLGLRKPPVWRSFGYIGLFYILTIVLVSVAFVLIRTYLPQIDLDQAQEVGFEFGRRGMGLVVSFVVTALLVPVIEELYFRGLLMPVLSRRFGLTAAVVLSSFVFALLHFQLNVGIFTFLLGLFLGWMYIRLNSIVPGIFLHIINNTIAFWLVLYY